MPLQAFIYKACLLYTSLNMPVISISAKFGDGLPKALQAATTIINQNKTATDPQQISQLLQEDNQIEREMEQLIAHHVQIPATLSDNTTDKIDRILLHKWLGLPIFFAAIFLLFQFIFTAGKPLQDGLAWALDLLRTAALEPLFANSPAWLSGLMLDGIFNGVATVAAFVPIIILFFLVMSMVEDLSVSYTHLDVYKRQVIH